MFKWCIKNSGESQLLHPEPAILHMQGPIRVREIAKNLHTSTGPGFIKISFDIIHLCVSFLICHTCRWSCKSFCLYMICTAPLYIARCLTHWLTCNGYPRKCHHFPRGQKTIDLYYYATCIYEICPTYLTFHQSLLINF